MKGLIQDFVVGASDRYSRSLAVKGCRFISIAAPHRQDLEDSMYLCG